MGAAALRRYGSSRGVSSPWARLTRTDKRKKSVQQPHGVSNQHCAPAKATLNEITIPRELVPGRLQIDTAEHKFYTKSVDGAADISQYVDNMIDSFYADCINWLRAWKVVIEENPAIEILMLDHALLASCTKDYFSRIFNFYNITQPADLELMNKTDEAHYRQGGNLEWRTTFNDEQLAQVNALLPSDLLQFFGWQR